MKYQFCIRFNNIDVNSSASKAVLDCNKIFSEHGYEDYTFTVGDNSNKRKYYYQLTKELFKFFLAIKPNSIVAIQYPLLSINNVFKYFIRVMKAKGVRFTCVIHDIESLRSGGDNPTSIALEIKNLSYYDAIIVHNEQMRSWLYEKGLRVKMITLGIFDYLSDDYILKHKSVEDVTFVFAGNLIKSTFVYLLPELTAVKFNLYGPGFEPRNQSSGNVSWQGVFPPDEIANKIYGNFGLIWDGKSLDECDAVLGNYLKYNNPHKASLYIVAGLPLIAPDNSAIGRLIKELNIGILVKTLRDLEDIKLTDEAYDTMRENVLAIRKRIIKGKYFGEAITLMESDLYA